MRSDSLVLLFCPHTNGERAELTATSSAHVRWQFLHNAANVVYERLCRMHGFFNNMETQLSSSARSLMRIPALNILRCSAPAQHLSQSK